uniref:Uncharacterized protein n=1 Tax=Cacopsylla melanoneura TaxID=428564 RepID=A0A8D9B0K9_9HEMI
MKRRTAMRREVRKRDQWRTLVADQIRNVTLPTTLLRPIQKGAWPITSPSLLLAVQAPPTITIQPIGMKEAELVRLVLLLRRRVRKKKKICTGYQHASPTTAESECRTYLTMRYSSQGEPQPHDTAIMTQTEKTSASFRERFCHEQ